jgi:hypothetical protein
MGYPKNSWKSMEKLPDYKKMKDLFEADIPKSAKD